jgi:hypothetical protein
MPRPYHKFGAELRRLAVDFADFDETDIGLPANIA